jgi:SAM-dependent methyltransferase
VPLPPLSPMATLRWQLVARTLSDLAPRRVLEVGCGQGGFGARIAARSQMYVGIEPDEQSYAVALGRIGALGGTVLHGAIDVVTADEKFELICAFEVIEHLADDAGALSEWISHLAPGGSVLVSVPAGPERFGPMDSLVGHYRRYTREQLSAVLRAAGCDRVEVRAYGWPLGYALEAVRNRIALHRGGALEAEVEPAERSQRSATSGRLLQPRALAGSAVRVGVAPFALLQRARPATGTGLVALGRVSSVRS